MQDGSRSWVVTHRYYPHVTEGETEAQRDLSDSTKLTEQVRDQTQVSGFPAPPPAYETRLPPRISPLELFNLPGPKLSWVPQLVTSLAPDTWETAQPASGSGR